jgi:hypothetical protein
MKKILLGLVTAALVSGSFAAGGDPSEKGLPVSPLKIYSGGVALGAMVPVSEKFKEDCGDVFVGVSFINSWQFRDNVALFADVSWFAPGKNGGLDAGVDYLLSTSSVRPFVGAGIGGHYFREGGAEFGDRFGPSLTAHIGCALDVTETVQVRLRAPYRFTLTSDRYQGFGVDLGVALSSKFKNIKKLNY